MLTLPVISLISTMLSVLSFVLFGFIHHKITTTRNASYATAAFIIVVYVILRLLGVFNLGLRLGAGSDLSILVDIIFGSIIGILINVILSSHSLRTVKWERAIMPLTATPLFVAPVWKMYVDQNIASPEFQHYVTFFMCGTTSGFAWKAVADKLRGDAGASS